MATVIHIAPRAWTVGKTSSAAVAVPGGVTWAQIAIVSSTWATDDPTTQIDLDVDESFDAGVTWLLRSGFCTGIFPRNFGRGGTMPGMTLSGLGGTHVRGSVTVSKPITFGFDLTLGP